jgi:hypothetical protein
MLEVVMVEHYAAVLALPPVPAQASWVLPALTAAFQPSPSTAASSRSKACVVENKSRTNFLSRRLPFFKKNPSSRFPFSSALFIKVDWVTTGFAFQANGAALYPCDLAASVPT